MKKRPFSNPQPPIPKLPHQTASALASLPSSRNRPAIPKTCWNSTWIWKPDLGIDTVKQAETFAAIRKEFDIPLREDLNLRDYNTIEKVIGFVEEMRPDLEGLKIKD